MNYRLFYRGGNVNNDGTWSISWDLTIMNANVIHFGKQYHVEHISRYANDDSDVVICLDSIPARIDKTEHGTVWVHSDAFVERFHEPYSSLYEKSETIYIRPNI